MEVTEVNLTQGQGAGGLPGEAFKQHVCAHGVALPTERHPPGQLQTEGG